MTTEHEEEEGDDGERGELESSPVQKLLFPLYIIIALFAAGVAAVPFIILYSLVRLVLSG